MMGRSQCLTERALLTAMCEWIKVKIEVRGEQARLYVHDAQQPTLIVNNLLHGTTSGAVALFISSNSLAHFSNLRVSP
jgi:hypothetical protein